MLKRKVRMKKKKKKQGIWNQNTIFPLILAALSSKPRNQVALIEKCLKTLLLRLPHLQLSPIISLLPSLLRFSCGKILRRSLEFIGAASLASVEMNEGIALDGEIIKGILSHLGSTERETGIAACNSLLDISTTSVGRCRLVEFDAISHVIQYFIQGYESGFFEVVSEQDGLAVLLLEGAVTLINSATIKDLDRTPKFLSGEFLFRLKKIWEQAHRQRLQGDCFCVNNIRTSCLAESIFRLSVNIDQDLYHIDPERVEKSIFGFGEVSLDVFLSEIWEVSPILIRNGTAALLRPDGIYSDFIRCLGAKRGTVSFVSSMLESFISCPPFGSCELEILDVIKEIKGHLGFPLVYEQDIRVVKMQDKELHFFQGSHVFSKDDISKCREALMRGFTLAIRGMEFRNPGIASVADAFASLFGQPSAGVNLYLTPDNSQGLARHSDDHCVFVCQLIGSKTWTLYPHSELQLPHLYESPNADSKIDSFLQFCLKEGDTLYIPRGCPHEAKACTDEAGFSLHLTLAVEVEPPFEWEGFIHIALHFWGMKQRETLSKSICMKLLHIAITLIGNHDSAFRKACLISAEPVNRFFDNQTSVFRNLINKIDSESELFNAASDHFKATIRKNEDPFEHLGWMKHLTEGSQLLYTDNGWLFDVMFEDRNSIKASFTGFKSRFCNEVEFETSSVYYKLLLEKYRKVRKQYANGMLSLHSPLLTNK